MAQSKKTTQNKDQEAPQVKRSALYARAQRVLRERHSEEWHQIMAEQHEAEGLVYRRRLSPKEREEREAQREREKAERQLERLVSRYPMLKDRVTDPSNDAL